MINLVKMDVYRMFKMCSVRVLLIIAAVVAGLYTPGVKLMSVLVSAMGDDPEALNLFPAAQSLGLIIGNPFSLMNLIALLSMLASSIFFWADQEAGYIKNIAGQMPKRGWTVLSKFLAVIALNLCFMVIGVVFNVLGTVPFQKLLMTNIRDGVIYFLLKFCLLQAVSAILLLAVTGLRSKSLGTALSVLMGIGGMSMIYSAVSMGVRELLKIKEFDLGEYMPDVLLGRTMPDPTSARVLLG